MENVPADVKRSLLSRIGAMAAVHEGIYASDRFETVDVAPYLNRLVANVSATEAGVVESTTFALGHSARTLEIAVAIAAIRSLKACAYCVASE